MAVKNIDGKLVAVFIFLVVLSVGYASNQEFVKNLIKNLLEWKLLNTTIWLSVFISFIIHYLSIKNDSSNTEALIYRAFGKFSDSAFAAVTYGLALTTSASILKGVYIQQIVGGPTYFNHFEEIDIYSMLVVCLFLFGYSTYATGHALINAIFRGRSKNATPAK